MKKVQIPITSDVIHSLKMGDSVLLSGIILTGRDAVHKWMIDNFIRKTREPSPDDLKVYDAISPLLNEGVIYHCGPIVAGLEDENYEMVAAGPTTSIREEPYQAEVMKHFSIRGVIGKGGMGAKTLDACHELPGVYFHAIGGAASLIARSVNKVLGVYKLDFGVPEAIWVMQVEDFPVVVTMDSHNNSLHKQVEEKSQRILDSLLVN